jgi:quinoprotein glucose dehydrogenase
MSSGKRITYTAVSHLPAPFDQQGITEDDLIDFTPSIRNTAREVFDLYDSGPLFTPPTERGTLTAPGLGGGASWAGASVDPEGVLYVPSVTLPFVLALSRQAGGANVFIGRPFPAPRILQGLMILKPP